MTRATAAPATLPYDIEKQLLDAQVALLQIDETFATTRKQRLALEQQILADQQKARRDAIALTIRDPNASADDKTKAVVEAQGLPDREAAENRQLQKQNESPLAAYQDQLKQATGDMHDALEGVAVDAFKGLEDGLTGLISGTESVSKAFKSMATSIIADLARIAIEKAIVSALGGSIFGIKLADGGKVDGHADGLLGYAMGGLPGYVDGGGKIVGPGSGRSDSILAVLGGKKLIRVSNGESIVTAAATKKFWPLIEAMNSDHFDGFAGGGVPSGTISMADISTSEMRTLTTARNDNRPISFDLRGAVMTADLIQQMGIIAAQTGGQVLHTAVDHTNRSIADLSRKRL